MRWMMRILVLMTCFSLSVGAQSHDIVVDQKVIVQRCVMHGVSSRTIAVGYPSRVSYAFDAVNCAPRFSWSGDFIDYIGESEGRGGKGVKALGVRQGLGIDRVPLRIGDPDALPQSVEFIGYRRGKELGAPTFLFEVDGQKVRQTIVPKSANEYVVILDFVEASQPKEIYYRLHLNKVKDVQLGEGLDWNSEGVIRIPAGHKRASFQIDLKPAASEFVRKKKTRGGESIYQEMCSACHSIDGHKLIGPSFKTLWISPRVVIRDGKEMTISADDAYVIESILKPQAAIVKGYEAVPMVGFASTLDQFELYDLLEYLKTIR